MHASRPVTGTELFRRPSALIDVSLYLLLLFGLVLLALRGSEQLGYNWQWYRVDEFLLQVGRDGLRPGPLLKGLTMTLHITWMSLALSLAVGLAATLLRLSASFTGRALARLYLEAIRNTPLLIQIFFMYFVLAPVLGMDRLTAGIIALSLFEGAYASEIIRAGIVSIDRGQWEAAHSLGLSRTTTYLRIILPQALRRILPPLTSQAVALIKDSALLSTIAVFELTMEGQQIIANTFLTFEIWFTVAALYLCMTLALSATVNVMEKRMHVET